MVIVIAVIAILAAVLIPTFGSVVANAKDSAAMQEARNAYAEYLAEAAATGVVEEDLFVEVDGGFVKIEDGVVTVTGEKYLTATASGKVLYNTGKVADANHTCTDGTDDDTLCDSCFKTITQ